ncbi:MAG: LmbE family protein [Planctomycetes bacterium]|nr:LmbE family protein [Planctomycetota bacterium]
MTTRTAFAIAAHPDDIEFMMAGTLLHLKSAGFEIHYMNLANGCCGSTERDAATTAMIRRGEAIRAAASIGAVFHESICNDLEIFYDLANLRRLTSIVREVAPEIVLTHSPVDYMEDHTNACRLAVTAAFARGMPNFQVDPPRNAVRQAVTVYHAQPYSNHDPLRRLVEPDFFVDVGDMVETKVAMLACHASQKQWLDESQGIDAYLQALRDSDAEVGRMSGAFRYAEGWRRHLHLGFCSAAAAPLETALSDRIVARRARDGGEGPSFP